MFQTDSVRPRMRLAAEGGLNRSWGSGSEPVVLQGSVRVPFWRTVEW